MILRRLSANLRAQNWTAIMVEFVLVVLGVFFGILAANWNLEQSAKRETGRLLSQLDSELVPLVASLESIETYYRVSGRFADRAMAGWRGDPDVSDNEFVIAAYQASQIYGNGTNSAVWAQIFGAENLRNIDDPGLRRNLRQFMAFDFALVNLNAARSRYREEVRKVIPNTLQDAIRKRCGDRSMASGILILPPTCNLNLPPAEAARTAAALRTRADLPGELNWHQAGIATQLQNVASLKNHGTRLMTRIEGP